MLGPSRPRDGGAASLSEQVSLLPDDAPDDVGERVRRTLHEQFRLVREWEPQLRAALRVSLLPGSSAPALRGGRAIGWFEQALAPLASTHPFLDRRRLAVRLRAVAGIECYVWLVDVAGLRPTVALQVMNDNALAALDDALSAPR